MNVNEETIFNDTSLEFETDITEEVIEEVNDPIIATVVNCEKLRVRKEPNTDADVLCILPKGSEVMVELFKSPDHFYAVITEAGIEGFCMKEFIELQ